MPAKLKILIFVFAAFFLASCAINKMPYRSFAVQRMS